MAQATLSQFRHLIRTLNYVVSTHAAEELEDENLSILDLENISSRGASLNASVTRKPAKSSASLPASRSTAQQQKRSSKSAPRVSSLSSQPISAEQLCVYCGSAALNLKHITRSFGKGAGLLVIESIPMWSCTSCGESYYSADTLHEIERIKALRKSIAVNRSVPVAAFQAVDA
jgi:YgiT-type zinc finger domain-containing protein